MLNFLFLGALIVYLITVLINFMGVAFKKDKVS